MQQISELRETALDGHIMYATASPLVNSGSMLESLFVKPKQMSQENHQHTD
jgi:hypothetical protein